ncbi:hypothetical protein AOR_1_394074 [Paecilomyces variotii No. 5]|uniref:Uncharacterized protein n=1 Tax=Byssochlamys spectabilis (strain No. 5 / NBRC 109023) TaxID=1356009 RepID=V5FD58_BYSSN|nr:hypothetical protein AOR_1_394074 [Paecilomyces variotii No. 5]
MNPYISWALVLVVAGGLGWYYTNVPHPKAKAVTKPLIEKVESVQETKKPKRKAKKASPAPAPAAKPKEKPSTKETAPFPEKAEEDDNKEFARQLAAAREGVTPVPKTKPSGKEKRTKEPVANHLESGSSEVSGSTRASSTTGADADDDLSPAGSPSVNPTAAGHVSDMLEPPAPGASVLRLTGSLETAPKKQKQQSFKPVETKKQRQQRLKNEERKRQTQEAEQERRKLLEKQLHTAREAERREAARSKQPTPANAWNTTPAATNGASKPAPVQDVGLLDTFEDKTPTATASSSSDSKQGKWTQALPSEEEQMRILGVSGTDDWTTVSSGKKGKKKTDKADEGVSDVSVPEVVAPSSFVEPKLPKVEKTYLPESFRTGKKNHPLDSDWAA